MRWWNIFLLKTSLHKAERENISFYGNVDYWQKRVKNIQDFGRDRRRDICEVLKIPVFFSSLASYHQLLLIKIYW